MELDDRSQSQGKGLIAVDSSIIFFPMPRNMDDFMGTN